jgi:hypothetical protein
MSRFGASDVALSRRGKGGHGMKRRYQIRDQDFGLAIYEADFAAEALGAFLADKVRAALEPADYKINDFGDGTRPSCGGASSIERTRQCPPPNRSDWHFD